RNLVKRLVDLDGSPPILFVPTLYFARLQRNHIDGCTGCFQLVAGDLKFRLLKTVGGENSYFLVIELHELLLTECPGPAMARQSHRSATNSRSLSNEIHPRQRRPERLDIQRISRLFSGHDGPSSPRSRPR